MQTTSIPTGKVDAGIIAARSAFVAGSQDHSTHEQKAALSYREAARVANVSERTIWTAANGGGLRSLRLGRRRLILRADLHAWLESLATSNDSPSTN